MKPRKTFSCGSDEISSLIFNEKIVKIYSGTATGQAHIWDIDKGSLIKGFTGHQAAVTALCTSQNDNQLFTGGKDAKIRIWD